MKKKMQVTKVTDLSVKSVSRVTLSENVPFIFDLSD